MELTINIKEEKVAFFIKLLQEYDYVAFFTSVKFKAFLKF